MVPTPVGLTLLDRCIKGRAWNELQDVGKADG